MTERAHQPNRAAKPRKQTLLMKYCDWLSFGYGSRVLDLGCGEGAAVRILRRRGYRAVGADLRPWDGLGALDFVLGDGVSLPFQDGAFDAVGSLTTLEHVPRAEQMLGEMVRVVRSGGRIVVAAPNMYGSILLHPGDSLTHTGGFVRYAMNLGLHLKKFAECMVHPSDVGFDRLEPDLSSIPAGATDYDAVCATDPTVLKTILKRNGVRIGFQSPSLEYPSSAFVSTVTKGIEMLPFIRDLFGGIFVVGHKGPVARPSP